MPELEDSMKKRIVLFSILFLFFVCILCKREGKAAASWEMEGECGPSLNWSITAEGELTITGTGKMTDAPWHTEVVEVSRLNLGEGITSICDEAFRYHTKLREVTLPHTLVEIGDSVFEGCKNLKTVSMQGNVEKIGERAFSQCKKLEKLPMSTGIKKIMEHAFYECCSLEDMNLPEGLEEIGTSAFNGCTSLVEMIIPKSVQKIGNGFIEDASGIRKVTNLSKINIELPKWGGGSFYSINVNWFVNGRKVKTLKRGQTAKPRPKVYPVKYKLCGAKVKGKLPKKYIYAKGVQLPETVVKKGYVFYGWRYSTSDGERVTNAYFCNPQLGGRAIIEPGLARFRLKNIGKHRIYVYVDLSRACKEHNVQIRYADNKEMIGAKLQLINISDDKKACGYLNTPALEPGKRYWFQFRGVKDLVLKDGYNVWGPKKSILVK